MSLLIQGDTMKFIKHIFSRGLPKAGQVIEHVAGDDGTYEAGWWVKRLNANNLTRFIPKTIGGDAVVIDRATGLWWAADGNAAGGKNGVISTWPDSINYANALDFAEHTDWRIPNIIELASLWNLGITAPIIHQSYFTNIKTILWSSNTNFDDNLLAVRLYTTVPTISSIDKAGANCYVLCVRGGL